MLYRSIWVSGADFIELMDLLTEEGSKFDYVCDRNKFWGHDGACFGRPDGFGSSDFAQIVDLFMLYRSIWVLGADFGQQLGIHLVFGANFIKIMDC